VPHDLFQSEGVDPVLHGDRCIGMPQIMDAYVVKPGQFSDAPPRLLQVYERAVFRLTQDNVRVALAPGQSFKNVIGLARQGNAAASGFAVRQFQMVGRDIVLAPM